MIDNSAQIIKDHLESSYDLPFDVTKTVHYNDSWFDIKPQNNTNELFDISVKFKDNLRLTIEVKPEKYAAFSIQDMSDASSEKKNAFASYATQLIKRKAKIDFFINDAPCDATSPETWPDAWKNYRLRATRSPICSEDDEFDEIDIASSWVTIITGMFLSLLDITDTRDDEHYEGGVKRVETNRYERNPINRELCIDANGYICKVCGFDFEKQYGILGHHFIHVHHIIPVSKMTESYVIDPENDLIPVCPNCHAMLHRNDPPLLPEELKQIILNHTEEYH